MCSRRTCCCSSPASPISCNRVRSFHKQLSDGQHTQRERGEGGEKERERGGGREGGRERERRREEGREGGREREREIHRVESEK